MHEDPPCFPATPWFRYQYLFLFSTSVVIFVWPTQYILLPECSWRSSSAFQHVFIFSLHFIWNVIPALILIETTSSYVSQHLRWFTQHENVLQVMSPWSVQLAGLQNSQGGQQRGAVEEKLTMNVFEWEKRRWSDPAASRNVRSL